jgi:benzoyl-CoA reductase/2-hydroxyglutaryl-CoA dehydratase subunit BcrC/BadD/HgdB
MVQQFGTTWEAAEQMREDLRPLRADLAELDRLTWEEGRVSGLENHTWLVSSSDFGGDVKGFHAQVAKVVAEAKERPPQTGRVRLGVVGVPPIVTDFYQWLEGMGGQVVFNEVQRQFSMTPCLDCDLVTQYRQYTYPYDVFGRIADISREIQRRGIDGIVHYVQSFCFRQIQDLLLKQQLPVPVLTLQGDKPARLDARNRLRLEAFLETLEARRG